MRDRLGSHPANPPLNARHPAPLRSYPQALIAVEIECQGLAIDFRGLENFFRGLEIFFRGMTFQPRRGGVWQVPNKQY